MRNYCSQARPSELSLSDHLARERTMLANERTLLAYLRSSFALLAAGGTLLKLFPEDYTLQATGGALIVLAAATSLLGFWRFATVMGRLKLAAEDPSDVSDELMRR